MSDDKSRALNHLQRLIKIGHYVENSRLPAERVLASELGVGRATLRHALSALESEGKITRLVGKGTFVGNGPSEQPELSAGVFISASPGEVMEARSILEPRLAAMAAANATPQDIDHLQKCVEKSRSVTNWTDWQRWDSTFHRTVAQCARNNLLAEIIEKFNNLRSRAEWQGLSERTLFPDRHEALVEQHFAVAEAIACRDPREASRAMREHLSSIESNFFDDDLEELQFGALRK